MTVLSKIIREPLAQFVLIGACVFVVYALVSGNSQDGVRDRLAVTEGRVQQLTQIFAKTWQRAPTPQELRGLIDAYVKEEVYYREALKLGLDRDDTLIRRRMQQKMEFLTEPSDDLLSADDAVLQDYLEANKTEFRIEPKVAFEQVFLNPNRSDEPAADRATQTLEALRATAGGSIPPGLGDSTLLPATTRLAPLSSIARDFGEAFATKLTDLPQDAWSGPIKSPYGLHIVRVTKRVDGYDPELAEVRDGVEQRWRTEKREDFQAQAYEKLRSHYDIELPPSKKSEPVTEPSP